MSFRLTEVADRDIERILDDTLELFGPHQFRIYSNLIEQALERVGLHPSGLSTSEREDIGPGVRSLRLADVTRRRGSASHSIYYLPPKSGAEKITLILRVLHDRMDPRRRVISTLFDEAPGAPPIVDDTSQDEGGSSPASC